MHLAARPFSMPVEDARKGTPPARDFGARQKNALVLRQSPKWMQTFAVMLAVISGGFLAAGFFIRIDEVVTATGQLESMGGRLIVKSPTGGKVDRLLVKNGDSVRKGQLMLVMDTVLATERLDASNRMIDLEQQALEKQLASMNEQLLVIDKQISTQTDIARSYKQLVEGGGIARIQQLQQEDRLFQLQSQRRSLIENIDRTRLESEKNIRELRSQVKEASVQKQYQNIVAPSDGIVFDLRAQQAGVLSSGNDILTLIPQGGLTAQIYIPNKDIGFIKIGQSAKVRIDAFPANRYGELSGKVSLVGADALAPDEKANFYRFPVRINLDKNYLSADGTKIPLSSGMSITTNLRIREKRLITIVTDLLSGQFDSIKSIRQ